jgi:hypothetical protein
MIRVAYGDRRGKLERLVIQSAYFEKAALSKTAAEQMTV